MKVTLSFEESVCEDVSVMVDVLRASTTITLALDYFKKIIPCFTPEDAIEVKNNTGGVLAGERGGEKIEGFDIGNTPSGIMRMKSDEDILILTTSNGTRILENMTSKVLVGSMVNAEAVACESLKLAENHIDVVMAGVKGEFAIEDFLTSGEIISRIQSNCSDCRLSEYAKASVLASRNYELLKECFRNSRSGERLIELGYGEDVELCLQRNISENVAVYNNNELTLNI